LKKLCWNCLKTGFLIVVIISSAIVILIEFKGPGFDPIREINKLKDQNRRDDALDLATFFKQNGRTESTKLSEIEKNLQYSPAEKIKAFVWDGAIKGQVYDSYSGLGAISSDLCLIGDVRDLGIQGWKYLIGSDDFDRFILILSAAGIGLSSTSFINGTNALAKNTLKYLKKVPASFNKGLLKKFLSGKVSPENCKKIWALLKKTTGPFPAPYPAYPILTT
jgi:hypothetical protein